MMPAYLTIGILCCVASALSAGWFGASRYTRLLEERVARLEAENAHLRNAIYARAGVGPVPLGPAPPANGAAERRLPQPAAAGRPLRRPISWAQVKQKLETEAASRERAHSPSGQVL